MKNPTRPTTGYHPGAIISDYYVTVTKTETTVTVVKVKAASQPEALRISAAIARKTKTAFGPVVSVDYTSKMEDQRLSRSEYMINLPIAEIKKNQ